MARLVSHRRELLAALSVLVFGALFCALFKLPDHLVLDTGRPTSRLGPITSTSAAVQELDLGSVSRVTAVEVLLSTRGSTSNVTHDEVRILDGTGREVARRSLPPGTLTDNAYYRLDLERPLRAGPHHRMFIVLSSTDGTRSQGITAWTNAQARVGGLYVLRTSPNVTPNAAAIHGGTRKDGSLCVHLIGQGSRRSAIQGFLRFGGLALCILIAAALVTVAPRAKRFALAARIQDLSARWRSAARGSSLGRLGARLSEDHLIRFGVRTQLLCITGALLLLVLVAGRVHSSSIEMWNSVLPSDQPGRSDSSLIVGPPKAVRSDEWATATPEVLHEYVDVNEVSKTTRLLDVVRPWNWGFYALGLERGFSLMWGFWLLMSLFATFFLVMLLSGNDFPVSTFTALFVLLSSYNRWWDITVEVACFSTIVVAIIYILESHKRLNIWSAWVLLCVFGLKFVLLLYPAWQVTLGYLIVFVVGGRLVARGSTQHIRQKARLKIFIGAATVVAALGAVVVVSTAQADTIHAMLSTVYPGRRVSTGGDLGGYQFFSGYLDYFFDQGRYFFTNICESSGFILLYPIVAFGFLAEAVRRGGRGLHPLVVSLLAYLVLLTAYVLLGFGPALSRVSLLSYVPAIRSLIGIGLASILLTALYLAWGDPHRLPRWLRVAAPPLALVALLAFFAGFERRYGFPSVSDAWGLALALAVATGALLLRRRGLFFAVMLLLVVVPSLGTNPVAQGLAPIYGKSLVLAVEKVSRSHPGERWLVYGNRWMPQIVKASGADVANGARYPGRLDMRTLDPSGSNAYVWNRFAHIQCEIVPRGEVRYTLNALDWYTLGINPADPRLQRLGIRLFVVPEEESALLRASDFAVLTAKPLNGYVILERRPPRERARAGLPTKSRAAPGPRGTPSSTSRR